MFYGVLPIGLSVSVTSWNMNMARYTVPLFLVYAAEYTSLWLKGGLPLPWLSGTIAGIWKD